MFQDDEEVISGRLLCVYKLVNGEEGYKLVMGLKAKRKKRYKPDSGVEDKRARSNEDLKNGDTLAMGWIKMCF